MTVEQGTLFDIPDEWWLPDHLRNRCFVCGGALSLAFDWTYVVQRQGWVKIGATDRPRQRCNELARVDWRKYILSPEGMDWTEPLIALTVIGGNIEHEMHQRFRKQHVVGEWFLPDAEMKEWIEEVT